MRRARLVRPTALAAAVLLLSGCAAPAARPNDGSPSAIEHAGRSVPYAGLQRWPFASIESRSSTRLSVFALGSDDGGGPCGPPILRISAQETTTTVRVSVAGYQDPAGPMTACPAVGYLATPHTVVLRSPLGDRRVVDAGTGEQERVLVGSDHPRLPTPSGLTATPLAAFPNDSSVSQAWLEHGEQVLWMSTTIPADARGQGAYGRIVRRFDVHGTPAVLFDAGDGESEIQWTPNDEQVISVRFDDTARRHWSTDQRIEIARSVTNYPSGDSGRLPLPSTPGTAVAEYSSADGPVRHAEHMWKSSGIIVGVECAGAGVVTVSLRGREHPVPCTAAASRHVFRSQGKPDEPFFVDIGATEGVRWSVVLARASLDGS